MNLPLLALAFAVCIIAVQSAPCKPHPYRPYVKDLADCTVYRVCYRGKYHQIKCRGNRHFNEKEQRCERRDYSKCPEGGLVTDRCAGLDDGIYREENNCARHFHCAGHKETGSGSCRGGMTYDLTTNMCTFPDLVTCLAGTEQGPCMGRADGYHQHPTYCGRYFYCIGGYLVHSAKCPYGLLFDNIAKKCAGAPSVYCPPVFGGWTAWREGRCSVRCGEGFQRRFRSCSNPKPANGGKMCLGKSAEKVPCVKDSCKDYFKKCKEGTLVERRYCSCPTHTLKGLVKDEAGVVLANAKIFRAAKISEQLATSSADGSFSVPGMCASSLERIVAKLDSYMSGKATATKTSATESAVSLTLTRTVGLISVMHPQSTMVYEGSSLRLTFQATGTPPPSFEWYRNGVLVSQSPPSSESVFTVPSASVNEAGSYKCRAVNSEGSLFSNEAMVQVIATSQQDTCDSTPEVFNVDLPLGCVNINTGQPTMNLGRCSGKPCLSSSSPADNTRCCGPSTREVVIIDCEGHTLQTSKVTACSCQPCQQRKTVIHGVVKAVGSGAAIANARIKLDGQPIDPTDLNGRFKGVVPTARARCVITIESDSNAFPMATKVVQLNGQPLILSTFTVAMTSFTTSFQSDSEIEIVLDMSNNAAQSYGKLAVAADSLALSDGTPFSGTATVAMTVIDPRQQDSVIASVGDFTSIDADGREETLQTSGMFAMEFKTDDGRRLRLTKPIKVSIDASKVDVQEGANLYYNDPTTGRWVKMAALTRQSQSRRRRRQLNAVFFVGFLTEPIAEFIGYYNVDKPWRPCFVKVKVIDPMSQLNVAGSQVSMVGQSGTWSYGYNEGVTDATGVCLKTICKTGGLLLAYHHGHALPSGMLPSAPHNGQPNSISQAMFVSFGTHAYPSQAETDQFIADAQSAAILGPVYSENQETECNNPPAGSRHFTFLRPPLIRPNEILGNIVNENHFEPLSWHSNGTFPTHCAIKVVLIGKAAPVVVKSYTNDRVNEYGTRIVAARQDPSYPDHYAACVPYKCTEQTYDGFTSITPITKTIVQVTPSASGCALTDINAELSSKHLNNRLAQHELSFDFAAPQLTSSDAQSGLYHYSAYSTIAVDRNQNLANCREGLDFGGNPFAHDVFAKLNPTLTFDCVNGTGIIIRPL